MYSADFRRLAFTKYRKCRCIRETARLLEVSPSTMHRWIHDTWWGKTFVARKRMRRARKVSQCVDAAIEAYFDFGDPKNERMKIACIRSLQRYVKTETSIDLSLSTLSRCVQMHGISNYDLWLFTHWWEVYDSQSERIMEYSLTDSWHRLWRYIMPQNMQGFCQSRTIWRIRDEYAVPPRHRGFNG